MSTSEAEASSVRCEESPEQSANNTGSYMLWKVSPS